MVPHVYNVNYPAPHPPASRFPEELKIYTKLFFVALAGVIGFALFWVFLTTLSSDVAAKVAEYSSGERPSEALSITVGTQLSLTLSVQNSFMKSAPAPNSISLTNATPKPEFRLWLQFVSNGSGV